MYKNILKLKPAGLRVELLVIALALSICSIVSVNANPITEKIKQVEIELGALVGVSIFDSKNKELWEYNGGQRFPLMSTFKALACAKLLADVDAGEASLASTVLIEKNSLITYSPVTENYVGKEFTLADACGAALHMSDNTAANIILANIGGPEGLTKFMRSIGDDVTRLDRIEPQLNEAMHGDLRDTTSATAMTQNLNRLLFGDVLSNESRNQLKIWMSGNRVSDSLLRSVLPDGWSIADRSGAGGFGSRGITAAVWSDEHPPLIVSIYLTQTEASSERRNKAIAEIGKEIFARYLD
jgi:beta-lactamase class A